MPSGLDRPGDAAGAYRGDFVAWNGGCIFLGEGGGPPIAPHAHYAIQLVIGPPSGLRVQFGRHVPWHPCAAALVPSRATHSDVVTAACQALVGELLATAAREPSDPRVLAAIDCIRQRLDDVPSLDEFARGCVGRPWPCCGMPPSTAKWAPCTGAPSGPASLTCQLCIWLIAGAGCGGTSVKR